MANYDSNYAIAQEISARIGTSPIPFDSVYSICLNIYNELGGEPAEFDSVYEILLGILPLVEGGGSNVIDDTSIRLDKTWSSSKISTDLVTKQGTLTAGANITIDSGNTISALLPAEDVQLPFMIYAYKKRPNVPVDNVPTEVPSSFIDENGDVIVDDNNGCYVVRMNDSYNNPEGIISGNYRYNKISVDKTILGYNYIIYKTAEYNNQYLTGAAEGADDILTTSPAVSLHRTMASTMITPFLNLLKSYDGKVICWQGQDGRVPSVVDVTAEPSVFNPHLYPSDEVLQGNTIMHCSTQLKKGHYYKLTFSKFNQYGIGAYTSWEQLYYNSQTQLGWVLCFDEIGNVIETITKNSEDIIELQSVIDDKQDTLTAGTNISIDASNAISALGYVYDASKQSVAEGTSKALGTTSHSEGTYKEQTLPVTFSGAANATVLQASGSLSSIARHILCLGCIVTIDGSAYTRVIDIDTTNNTITLYDKLSSEALSGATLKSVWGVAYGKNAHSEGRETAAFGNNSHTEGENTVAAVAYCHAEGVRTIAVGRISHAEGFSNTASGLYSHVEGCWNNTSNDFEHASGVANLSHKASTNRQDSGNTLFSIGNGSVSGDTQLMISQANAFEVMQNGDTYILGVGGYQGTDTKVQNASIMTVQEVINSKADAYQTATTADIEALFA